jgi:hypothetical protein
MELPALEEVELQASKAFEKVVMHIIINYP